jgi:hypothetical protein
MATPEGTNLERLRQVGLIMQDLPTPYQEVVDGLTDDEVEILLSIQKRLAQADELQGAERPGRPSEPPAYTTYVIF